MATEITPIQGIRMAARGVRNYITGCPLVVSYEVTLSCNCNCRHCDLGGMIAGEQQLQPDDYACLTRELHPVAVQISGGEPLLRQDIVPVARAIKQSNGMPYLILVTNGALLNKDNYRELCEMGVNQVSVSLDFPDERHDEFRRHKGLFSYLDDTIPELAKLGYHNIILNSAITKANFRELMLLARKAQEWGVAISYSAYTALRTGEDKYSVRTQEDLDCLRSLIAELLETKKKTGHIANSRSMLFNTLKFFEQGSMPDCKAGKRFFVVMPEGSFIPCSLNRHKYCSRQDMVKGFSQTNQCGGCYVAIRSYSDRTLRAQLKDFPDYAKRILPRR
jgi:MoaA/NifB/PqqE/SkfB family radical SAM enzyme